MKRLTKLLIISILPLCLMSATNSYGSDDKFKVGDVNRAELEMKQHETFPDAKAVILREEGNSFVEVNSRGSIKVVHERHVRIKFFKKEGFEHAEFNIPLYQGRKSNDEDLVRVKAYTFNIKDGDIDKTRFRKRNVVTDEKSERWSVEKFTMPKVREGSVIDVYYKKTSPYIYNFEDWQFQHEIPTVLTRYKALIPKWYTYNINVKGYENVEAMPVKNTMEWLYFNGQRMQEKFKEYRYEATNVPAMKEEPYMTTKENFITEVTFELQSVHYPGDNFEFYSRSWKDVSKELLNSSDFGRQITRNHLRKEAKKIAGVTSDKLQQALMARNFIAGAMNFNGTNRLMPKNGNIKRSYKDKKGNSADINMNLIALLNKMDIDVKPAVLSTRQHGYIFPAHATVEDLNYVLAAVTVGNRRILLDATEPTLSPEMLPKKCLNGRAVILDEEKPQLVDVLRNENYTANNNIMVTLDSDSIIGECRVKYSGLMAHERRKAFKRSGKEAFSDDIIESSDGMMISEMNFENVDSLHKSMIMDMKFREKVNHQGADMLYIDAMYGDYIDENPFKLKNRKFPVDFACPRKYQYRIIVSLPEGYNAHSLPEPAVVTLPGESATFEYLAKPVRNNIIIQTTLDIEQVTYTQQDYPLIKKLFQKMVDKYEEKIVLKKEE
ncbi:MAG: DUF3857 domain-containing protein [Bacteroidales bacterium]|nr:DUF3857 domain-containing protein [Bacteroidales bacterium]MCF8332887.1 DUF3857 domain-containing protein [Bacteroidales bacterium]